MTRVVFYTATTLDGYIADENDSLDWLFKQEQDEAGPLNYDDFIKDVGAIAMGATTYLVGARPARHGSTGLRTAGPTPSPAWVFTHRDLPGSRARTSGSSRGDVGSRTVRAGGRGGRARRVGGRGGDLAAQFAEAGHLDEIIASHRAGHPRRRPADLPAPLRPPARRARPEQGLRLRALRGRRPARIGMSPDAPIGRSVPRGTILSGAWDDGAVTTTEPGHRHRLAEITTSTSSSPCSASPASAPATKGRPALLDVDRDWLAATPFCVMATAAADGTCDACPKGDPAGALVHVDRRPTIALAERPGNRRADGYRNILDNPHVGLNFLIPGRGDTLRINGRARLVSDAPFFDDDGGQGAPADPRGRRRDRGPVLPLREGVPALGPVEARDLGPEAHVPRRAVIASEVEPNGMSVEQLDDYYGPSYEKGLYGYDG